MSDNTALDEMAIHRSIYSFNRSQNSLASIEFIAEKSQWDALLELCPNPHLAQSFAFGEGKAAAGWTPRRVIFRMDGVPVAIATVLEMRRLGVRLLARVNRGPLFLKQNPSDAVVVAVYKALRRRWGRFPRGILLIAPALHASAESQRLMRSAGYRLRAEKSWRSGRIALSGTEDQLWKGFSSSFRNRVRSAEKSGAGLRISRDEDTFEWMVARHIENMSDKQFKAIGAHALRAMRAASPEDIAIYQMTYEGAPIAAMSVVRFGRAAEYHIGWFGPEGRSLNAGNFLMWHIMRDLQSRGVSEFDVGGMGEGKGYTQFKRTMKPTEYDLANEWISF